MTGTVNSGNYWLKVDGSILYSILYTAWIKDRRTGLSVAFL